MTSAFISYLRVSTERQGRSGLGLEAQRRAVADFLAGGAWRHVAELVEVESGSRDSRPRLAEAMALCRLHAATLVIAKLDRLSRDAAFLLNLQKAGVRFVAADMPEANELVVGIMAVVAQAERKMISARTKAALAAAKARGVRLGKPENLSNREVGQARSRAQQGRRAAERVLDLAPVIATVRSEGAVSLRQIAAALNVRGIPAARGGAWSAAQVRRVLAEVDSHG
ncbi:recombinase family protein [Methylobacterium sp. J-030]|uniref:recombinase family protein n=1 Tax=Methylobacterium sp. J-030 TaxID=2836627 RepID=UPI001FB877E7|nr:recombinase family protein [Methylobacterium sp. J-030]MCJ2067484.1 recombinase family protein [Methylobacterium sp. J-030]